VHAERAAGSPRTAVLIAAAALAGICVELGCASEASARRLSRPGDVQVGMASYYGKGFVGKRTANGERFDPNQMTAAHKTLPFGTRVRVTRMNGSSVVVRVNDRCGCTHGRIIDVTEGAARKLGMISSGIAKVRLEVLPAGGPP
jgi:rare lipoprotein A